MFMRTRRLFLRPPFEDDWQAVHRALAGVRLVPVEPCGPWPYEAKDTQNWCKDGSFPALRGEMRLLVTLPAVGLAAGNPAETADPAPVIGVVVLRPEGQTAELSCWIADAWLGQGFASEALEGAVQIAHMLGYREVQAGHLVDDTAAQRLQPMAAFAREAERAGAKRVRPAA